MGNFITKKATGWFMAWAIFGFMITSCGKTETNQPSSETKAEISLTAQIVEHYLSIKDALVANDGKLTAEAGAELYELMSNFNAANFDVDDTAELEDIAEGITENAEHISVNADNIFHLREHLEFLSRDVLDFIAEVGSPQKLYQLECSTYNDGKGVFWLSSTVDTQNPYEGESTPDCSEMVAEIE